MDNNKKDKWEIIGKSDKIQEMKKVIEQVAPSDISVLIVGESGTGKEMIAKALHNRSNRKNEQMVSVNCGAIPEGILESELFGHEKGSFTGAIGQRKGYFEIASKGSIFLDEIGEMSLYTQVKLLRVLEEKEFLRVGGNVPIKVDTRVIASTNKDLELAVNKGEFRKDLYYRLKAVTIYVPPLRERKEDIELLVNTFMEDFKKRNNISVKGISPEAVRVLKEYSWPGNVRELKNLIESVIILNKGEVIKVADLPENVRKINELDRNLPVHLKITAEKAERELIYRTLLVLGSEMSEIKKLLTENLKFIQTFVPDKKFKYHEQIPEEEISFKEDNEYGEVSLQFNEKELVKKALIKHKGNRKKAAKDLGISERTLYRKLHQFNL
jgi:transcriptional regulator with PAS, ATPase and Fis domain